jgi:hypothetical protein
MPISVALCSTHRSTVPSGAINRRSTVKDTAFGLPVARLSSQQRSTPAPRVPQRAAARRRRGASRTCAQPLAVLLVEAAPAQSPVKGAHTRQQPHGMLLTAAAARRGAAHTTCARLHCQRPMRRSQPQRAAQRCAARVTHPRRLYPSRRGIEGDSYSHSLPLPMMNMSWECASSCAQAAQPATRQRKSPNTTRCPMRCARRTAGSEASSTLLRV